MKLQELVGKNIRRFRREMGISQEELGFRCELHRTYISGVERGVRNPTVSVIGQIAEALNVEPKELLDRSLT